MARDDALEQILVNARRLMVDIGRHVDLAAEGGDVAQVARAWVRAAELEGLLRRMLPPEVTEEARAAVESATPTSHAQEGQRGRGGGGGPERC